MSTRMRSASWSTIDGEPNFVDPEPLDMGDIEMWAGSNEAVCRPSDDLGGTSISSQL